MWPFLPRVRYKTRVAISVITCWISNSISPKYVQTYFALNVLRSINLNPYIRFDMIYSTNINTPEVYPLLARSCVKRCTDDPLFHIWFNQIWKNLLCRQQNILVFMAFLQSRPFRTCSIAAYRRPSFSYLVQPDMKKSTV